MFRCLVRCSMGSIMRKVKKKKKQDGFMRSNVEALDVFAPRCDVVLVVQRDARS